MTTIAWDGTTLAGDRASWSGGCMRTVRKVFRVKRFDTGEPMLVGFAGNQDFCTQVLRWMQGGSRPDPRDFFTLDEMDKQCALVIDSRRRVWSLGQSLVYTPMRERRIAFGGGQEVAIGALEAGATAPQAIRIAIKRTDYAGIGVDCVRLP